MILFFLKKTFADGWDNLLRITLFNIFFSLLAIALYFLGSLFIINEITAIISIVICITIFFILIFMVNEATSRIAHFKSISLKETFLTFSGVWKDAVLMSLIVAAVFFILTIGIPFYMSFGSMFGVFLAAVLFWAITIVTLSLQWFLPIRAQLKDPFVKALKKSFIIFFDNVAFSVFLFIYSVILLVLSVFLAFFVPGVSSILLAQNNAFKLRLYKYDWLEVQTEFSPREARKNIPWGELLANDRETLGPRTIRNLIFPWKD